jgi:putative molybdopterin biosynthesis protein
MADAGLGVEPAARQFNLDFLPVIQERYTLTCKTSTLDQPAVSELISLLKGAEFARVATPVAGYVLDSPGEVATVETLFPWLAVKSR